MNRKKVEEKFRAIVMDVLNIEESELKEGARFRVDLYADWIDKVDILLRAEKEFGISIADEEVMGVVTFGDALNLITRKTEEQ